MDTSTVAPRADTLGRRVVARNFRSLEEKLRIIAEARSPGASVAAVARKHGVNANLVFAWMRLQEQGVLQSRTRRAAPRLLAVTVTSEAVLKPSDTPRRTVMSEHLEIALPNGICLRVFGAVPSEQLERVLRLLRR
jgi:transposase